MQKVLVFAALLGSGLITACTQSGGTGSTSASASVAVHPVVKEIKTVADVPATPKSMDFLAAAERHLGEGHRMAAAGKITEGIASLRQEIGAKANAEAKPVLIALQRLQERLAKNEPVTADALHKAILDVLVYAPVQLNAEVISKSLEVDNPGGAIPKMYKSEKPDQRH